MSSYRQTKTLHDRDGAYLELVQRPAVELNEVLTRIGVHAETDEARRRLRHSHPEHARGEHVRASGTRWSTANGDLRVTGRNPCGCRALSSQ